MRTNIAKVGSPNQLIGGIWKRLDKTQFMSAQSPGRNISLNSKPTDTGEIRSGMTRRNLKIQTPLNSLFSKSAIPSPNKNSIAKEEPVKINVVYADLQNPYIGLNNDSMKLPSPTNFIGTG
jgi:hypothetical protein